MKTFKRLLALFFAAVMMLSLGMIHVSAYDICDVNHDGSVTVSDVIALSRYLKGSVYVNDYDRFDTNRSQTIDYADVKKISAVLSQSTYSAKYWNKNANTAVTFPTFSGATLDPDASKTGGREYIKHLYATNDDDDYVLTPTLASFNAIQPEPEPRNIIGTDDRQYSLGDENTGIVKLLNAGTGFIVGDHVIATAAHCVYSRNSWSFMSTPTIRTYNLDGTLSTTSLTPIEVHVPYYYTSQSLAAGKVPKYDYALITVSQDLSSYTHFSLGTTYNLTPTNYSSIPLYLLGPGMEVNGNNTLNLYYSQGSVVTPTNPTFPSENPENSVYSVYYNCDSLPGDSGSPVYTITKVVAGGQTYYYYTAIAIHTRNDGYSISEWNAGTRMTKYHLQFFSESTNENISY